MGTMMQQAEARSSRRAVVMGKTGFGKSTLTTMLVQGNLEEPQAAPLGHGLRGTTEECKSVSGRDWTVIDTVGMGEASCGTVPDQDARQKVISFLESVKGRYTHLLFVIEKGRLDSLNTVMWKTFLEVFRGAEEHFVVVYTKARQDWLEEQMEEIRREFPECCKFACVDFRPPSEDEEEEEELAECRAEELQRFEAELDKLVPPNRWGTPDITKMNPVQTAVRAESILRKIARLLKEVVDSHVLQACLKTASIIVDVALILASFG
ncbi:hypothetical protein L7F22_039658 [Adiantum nelumboides]|nr:hypothetical protein [Adiantum nelumboides]